MSSQRRCFCFAQWIVRICRLRSDLPRRMPGQAVQKELSHVSRVRCLASSLLGLAALQLGCFSAGVSSMSGVSTPATRLAPTDPSLLAKPVDSDRAATPASPSRAAGSDRDRARSADPQTGLLVPPLPQDLPPIPINHEAN